MLRLVIIPVLFVIACLLSGLYGAAHNQISYTVSPEYFTKFKFHQFDISPHLWGRDGAAIVGWQASWWMGIGIGALLIPLGLLIRGNAAYFFGMLRVFGVVVLTTMTIGLLALALSFLTISPETAGEFSMYNNEVLDPVAFRRAGTMHNFSYLGGLIGIVTGALTIMKLFLRDECNREISASSREKPVGSQE